MKIELKKITIRELAEGYADNDKGVVGYSGKLDIRPPYQREFIYKPQQRDAVIHTVTKDFPLNVMYWSVRKDGNFEIIDGQQRTISICQYAEGVFSVNKMYLHSYQKDKRDKFLDYKLTIYQCSGTDSEKLEWFKTINIAGEKLSDQELRNAVYSGTWTTDAKRHFSKRGCAAYGLGGNYLNGSSLRQDYLETSIKWISNDDIDGYMAKHQHKPNADSLWLYFQSVIAWVKTIFPTYRDEMKGIGWGSLYNLFQAQEFDKDKLEAEISRLMEDEDVSYKKGIYSFVLDGKEKHLNIRAFSKKQKREAYQRQKGICPVCREHLATDDMEADHIKPWHDGGKTILENCQMLCNQCNRTKAGK